MAFPETIDVFPQMEDISASDGNLITEYQNAMKAQDTASASEILTQIPNWSKKLISASYLNSITSACNALEQYYLNRYSPAYVVSATQPANQNPTDFWFQITG